MANLIDSTYFDQGNEISLPSGKYDDRTTFITRFEKEFLIRVFGYTLYKYIAAYSAETSAQRIKDIVEGKEFTITSGSTTFTYKWNGLKNTEKISPIAYYIFYKYVTDHQSIVSTTGETQANHENSTGVLGTKALKAWNEMYELTSNELNYCSLYYFMQENSDDYPEWEYKGFEEMNSFDI
jgi:hypothetical protein